MMTTEKIDRNMAKIALAERSEEQEMRYLAEECAELAQAALKYIRAFDVSYISETDAMNHLAEEIGDVENVIAGTKALIAAESPFFLEVIRSSREYKIKRWVDRIEAETGERIEIEE